MDIFQTFRERFGVDPREIAGARVSGEVPASNELVNRLIAERVAQHPQIASLRVQAQQGNTLAVEVRPRARFMPALRLALRIERQPEFPQNPVLLLRWSMPAAGPLAAFAAPLLGFFKAMPPGIRLDGDRLAVDLGELLRQRGQGELIMLVRRLAIHTAPGAFVVQFEAGVPLGSGAAGEPDRAAADPSRGPAMPAPDAPAAT